MMLHSLECQFLTIALCDVAEPCQLGSQEITTPMMQGSLTYITIYFPSSFVFCFSYTDVGSHIMAFQRANKSNPTKV